ncbi:MAG: DUF4328 domain-containing protein [Deltaproteobacteria bacterium]|nr:DUF4328 domain-containing protein [Deltaproteobacteria bacterium]
MRDPNPFAPPEAELKATPPADALKAIGSLVPWIRGTGYAQVGFTVVTMLLTLAGAEDDPESALALIDALVSIPMLLALLANGLLLYIWVYRAVKAAQTLREAPQPRGPGMTVASFFLPIVSLFWPYQSVKALFQASAPEDGFDVPFAGDPTSTRILLWWGAHVISAAAGQAYMRMSLRPEIALDGALVMLDLVGDCANLIEVPLSIWVVATITTRMLERARRLGVPLR